MPLNPNAREFVPRNNVNAFVRRRYIAGEAYFNTLKQLYPGIFEEIEVKENLEVQDLYIQLQSTRSTINQLTEDLTLFNIHKDILEFREKKIVGILQEINQFNYASSSSFARYQ